MTTVVSAAFIIILLTQAISVKSSKDDPVYVGVTFGGNTPAEAKLLIDRVKGYTNLFVLGMSPVSKNETATNEVADYAVANELNLMVNFGYYDPNPPPDEMWRTWEWQLPWLEAAKEKYGDRFLGVYLDDEPGGIHMDYDWTSFFKNCSWYFDGPIDYSLKEIYAKVQESEVSGLPPADYNLEAHYYVYDVLGGSPGPKLLDALGIAKFTSDYVLYWFDYLAGYDVMLAQLGWNTSTVQQIALVKGAARLQNKAWGSIITWTYHQPPYLASGEEIYQQMVESYQAGARYIMIFNYPNLDGNNYGVMQDEHFAALERFWDEVVKTNDGQPREFGQADAAFVLPKNYGWGMRNPNDRIWGIWGPDDKSAQIWSNSEKLLSRHGLRLDIVYDDPAFPLSGRYSRVYYWNNSVV